MALTFDRPKVIASNAVRSFVSGGGTLRFVAVEQDGAKRWAVVAVSAEGEELPVMLSHALAPKLLHSPSAVHSYHRKICPHEPAVLIPHHDVEPPADSEG